MRTLPWAALGLGFGLLACNAANPSLSTGKADLGTTPDATADATRPPALDGSAEPRCVPGRVEACPCPGGAEGTQRCGDDGAFEACACAPTSDSGTGGDAPPADLGQAGGGGAGGGPHPADQGPGGGSPPPDAGPGEPDASAQPDAGPGCVEGTVEVGACGLNGRGEVSRRCVDAAWVEDAPCVDPDQCVDAAVEAVVCGFNGNGRETSECLSGQWVLTLPCDDLDECANDSTEARACGLLGNGTQSRLCAAGLWGAWSDCDDPDLACEDGARESVPCGLNRRGFRSHTCVGMRWGEFGPCEDPDACIDAAQESGTCGLNSRGTRFRVCAEGQWSAFGDCDDADVCVDGQSEARVCGLNARGAQSRTCVSGQWSAYDACVDPDVCVDDAPLGPPCGLNLRGRIPQRCVAGQPGPQGPCLDPDECVDARVESQPCGALGDGLQSRTCALGHFGPFGACIGATPCPDPANPACPQPRPEWCNGLDDDLDGQTDEDLSGLNVAAGPFEAALEPVLDRGLAWLRAREGGLGRFNSNAESTSSGALGTLTFLERRSAGGVGPALGYAGSSPQDREMLVRVVRFHIVDDEVLQNPNLGPYVYRTGVNLAALSRFLETGGPDDVGAPVSVRTAVANGVAALRTAQGQGTLWSVGGPGLDLEMSYMAATGLSAASRVLPGADATLSAMGPGLDALQNQDGGFAANQGQASTAGATWTGLWLHRLAETPADDPRVLSALDWVARNYVLEPAAVGLAAESTYWQPWNGTRALQGHRLTYANVAVGTLDPASLGYPAAPRGVWFDTAHTLLGAQQPAGSWPITPPGGRSLLSMQALSLLTLERSLGGARLTEADLSLRPACNDRVDNDGDGRLDLQDPDCPRACASTESLRPVCDNARDDDADGAADFPHDPGCLSPLDDDETDPACGNRRDDDADGRTDWPADPGCEGRRDPSEQDPGALPACANGRDDDGDALIDFGRDPECLQAAQNDERLAPPCLGGAPVRIAPGITTYDGVTAGNEFQGSCGGVRGNDSLFVLVADLPMDVVFSTANDQTAFDTVLYLRRSCDATPSELLCNDDVSAQDPLSTLSARLEPGTYFLVVDATVGGGAFRLTVTSTPRAPACADGQDNDADGATDLLDRGCATSDDASEVDPGQAPACDNTRDDDADGRTDFPWDTGCAAAGDADERDPPTPPACANGLDDDADGRIDWPDDPSCLGRGDDSEFRPVTAACGDAQDNDGDAFADFPFDPGCLFAADRDEADPVAPVACNDTVDNDADGRFDFPFDPGCTGRGDADEADPAVAPACFNGRDDDADGDVDFPRDPGCAYAADASEADPAFLPDCFDGDDDDANGRIDWPDDPGCYAASDPREDAAPPLPVRCADGADNDQDGRVDLADIGCNAPTDDDEADPPALPACGNGVDDDQDNAIDWPRDPQCLAAGDITENLSCRAGVNVPLIPRNGTVNGATLAAGADRYQGACGGVGAPDAVYRYALAQPRNLTISVDRPGTRFPAVVSVRRDCENAGAELACAGGVFAPSPTVSLAGAPAGDYFIFVDGAPTTGILSRGLPIALPPDPRGFVASQVDLTPNGGWADGGSDAFDNYGYVTLTVAGQATQTTLGESINRVVGGVNLRTTRDFANPNVLRYRIEAVNANAGQRATISISGNLGSDQQTLGQPVTVPFGSASLTYLRTTDNTLTDPAVFQMLVPSDPADAPRLAHARVEDDVTLSATDVHLPAVFYLAVGYHPEPTVFDALATDLTLPAAGNQTLFGNFELSVTEQ
jgi:hypothetical protein